MTLRLGKKNNIYSQTNALIDEYIYSFVYIEKMEEREKNERKKRGRERGGYKKTEENV